MGREGEGGRRTALVEDLFNRKIEFAKLEGYTTIMSLNRGSEGKSLIGIR